MASIHNLLSQAQRAWRDCRWEDAQRFYNKLLDVVPNCFEAHNGLGVLYREWGHYEQAHSHLEKALILKPDRASVWGNWGRLYADLGQTDLALEAYQQAHLLTDDRLLQSQLSLNRALVLLAAGHWQAGWSAYVQWSANEPGLAMLQGLRWQGESLAGETLWIDAHTHCGYGDILMFGRYLPLLVAQGAKVIIACPDAMADLLQTIPGIKTVPSQIIQSICHKWVPLYLLPFYLSPTLDSIPPPLSLTSFVRPTHSPSDFTIAINGACHPQSRSYIRRHCPLEVLQILGQTKPCRWLSLQTDISLAEATTLKAWPHMHVLGSQLKHFGDTLNGINQADLVITVDSVMAHLAGTLGKPVWILLPYAAEWRWFQQRSDSPWYPNARLWRQAKPGDWQGLVNKMQAELC